MYWIGKLYKLTTTITNATVEKLLPNFESICLENSHRFTMQRIITRVPDNHCTTSCPRCTNHGDLSMINQNKRDTEKKSNYKQLLVGCIINDDYEVIISPSQQLKVNAVTG